MYGITETTVHVTFHRLSAQDIAAGGSVIGRPLPDLSIDLLDRYGQQVAIGVAGEIIVGGDGVAKGYLNLPAQTAERFIDPSMQSSGTALASGVQAGRAYRSGDLARWLPDGNLEYLGRIDQQVKIRGFRIEMGEIETCLAQHPLISEAAVDVQNDALGARLIAYVVAKDWQDAALRG